jgi:hypothetical protein
MKSLSNVIEPSIPSVSSPLQTDICLIFFERIKESGAAVSAAPNGSIPNRIMYLLADMPFARADRIDPGIFLKKYKKD